MVKSKQYKAIVLHVLLILITVVNTYYHQQKLNNIYRKIKEKSALNNINTSLITKQTNTILAIKELHNKLDLTFDMVKYNYSNKNTMSVIISSQNLYLDLKKLNPILNKIQQQVSSIKINNINKEIIITMGGIK